MDFGREPISIDVNSAILRRYTGGSSGKGGKGDVLGFYYYFFTSCL
jgi:hypothetical protein